MGQRTSERNQRSGIVPLSLRMILSAVLLTAVSTAWAGPYTKFVVLGDSLSDIGNNGSRNSNGPLWVEDLAVNLGVPSATASSLGGTNFAFSGSTTAALGGQVSAYLSPVSNVADPGALYIVWSGANDFFGGIIGGPAYCATNLPTWAGNVSSAVSALHNAGAVNFLVPNLPPLGNVPMLNGQSEPYKATVNGLVGDFNDVLAANLTGLKAAHSDLAIHSLDTYSLFNRLAANPSAYGFDNVTAPASTTAGDDNRFLFWDDVHPTAAGHALLAQTVPEPSALALLMIGAGVWLAGMVCYRRSSSRP